MEGLRRKRGVGRLVGMVLVALALFQMSCGTILYPERKGQKGGQLDVAVILLDGACLLVFIIPGVIAFAVDFATGAIYLPPERSSERKLQEVHVAPGELTPQHLEEIVRQHTGKTVHLEPGQYRAMQLDSIDEFTPETVAELESNPGAAEVSFPRR